MGRLVKCLSGLEDGQLDLAAFSVEVRETCATFHEDVNTPLCLGGSEEEVAALEHAFARGVLEPSAVA
jgi:hypothetical protein